MSFVEKSASVLNGRAWTLANSALLLLFAGLLFVETGTDATRKWGFVTVALGILFGGLAIFSELFAPKEDAFADGKHVRISKASRAGALPRLIALAFFVAWLVGLCAVTVLLIWRIMRGA